jgi:hypothetical protein
MSMKLKTGLVALKFTQNSTNLITFDAVNSPIQIPALPIYKFVAVQQIIQYKRADPTYEPFSSQPYLPVFPGWAHFYNL